MVSVFAVHLAALVLNALSLIVTQGGDWGALVSKG